MDLEGLLKKRIKSSDGMYKLFTEKLSGCWVMAQALKKFLGNGELYTVVDEGEPKQIVLMVGNDFVNAGGVRDAGKLLNDLKKGREYKDPHLRSFKSSDVTTYPSDELVNKVVAYFKDGKDVDVPKPKAAASVEKAKPVEKPEPKPAPPPAKPAAKPEPKPVEKKPDPLADARARKAASRQKKV